MCDLSLNLGYFGLRIYLTQFTFCVVEDHTRLGSLQEEKIAEQHSFYCGGLCLSGEARDSKRY